MRYRIVACIFQFLRPQLFGLQHNHRTVRSNFGAIAEFLRQFFSLVRVTKKKHRRRFGERFKLNKSVPGSNEKSSPLWT